MRSYCIRERAPAGASRTRAGVEALLEEPRVESLYFFRCGKALKGPIRERLQSHGFPRLEIQLYT
jgi:hypothetical protein